MGELRAPEGEDERGDGDAEDCCADECGRDQQPARLSRDREQEEGDHREREVGELVPDPGQRHSPADLPTLKTPAPEQGERACDADRGSTRDDVRQGGRGLRQCERPAQPESRQHHHPRRGEREDVEHGRGGEHRGPGPRERLDHVPDVAVVRDARKEEREGEDDEREPGDAEEHAATGARGARRVGRGSHTGRLTAREHGAKARAEAPGRGFEFGRLVRAPARSAPAKAPAPAGAARAPAPAAATARAQVAATARESG